MLPGHVETLPLLPVMSGSHGIPRYGKGAAFLKTVDERAM
jgi:hypothetical protein